MVDDGISASLLLAYPNVSYPIYLIGLVDFYSKIRLFSIRSVGVTDIVVWEVKDFLRFLSVFTCSVLLNSFIPVFTSCDARTFS